MQEIQSFPLQWPLGWKRTQYPKPSPFKRDKTIYSSCKEITHQLSIMKAKDVVISTNIPIKNDGYPYSTYKTPVDKGTAVYFSLKGSPHVLACDKWNSIEHNLWAIAKHIESLRGQERWGVGSMEQAFTGYTALPEAGFTEPWYQVLGISQNPTEAEILSAFRMKAKEAHPDAGGSSEAMHRINQAKEQALNFIKK
jgi:hypothetical protein